MTEIRVLSEWPLILAAPEAAASALGTLDAGAAYTNILHRQVGEFERKPLRELVDISSQTVNPQSPWHSETTFDYVDLRQVDDIFGHVLAFRSALGSDIGSTKVRFRMGDILFAKIMPSLSNKSGGAGNSAVTSHRLSHRPRPAPG